MTNTPTIPKGFIPWAGGECPVPGDSKPTIMFADGFIYKPDRGETAATWTWMWPVSDDIGRIVAYRPEQITAPPIDWQAEYEALRTSQEGIINDMSERFRAVNVEKALGDMPLEIITGLHDQIATEKARAEKAEAELERRNDLFNVETAGQIISALHSHSRRQEEELATLRAKDAKIERLREALAFIEAWKIERD